MRDFLEQGYVDHTDDTFFAGIRKLPPAHSLVVDERGLRLEPLLGARAARAWTATPPTPCASSSSTRCACACAATSPSARASRAGSTRRRSSCAVDHLLRTEAENARPVGDRQRTFTAFFEERGFDERPFAEAVVAQTRSQPHWVTFDSRELVDVLPSIVRTQDEPFGSTSIVAQWFVMRAAKEAGLKVMLDGQGADEIARRLPRLLRAVLRRPAARAGSCASSARELRAYRTVHGAGVGTTAVALARPFLPERVRWAARGRVRGGSALVHPDLPATSAEHANGFDGGYLRRQMHLILTRRGLPELLHYEDRNSMAHSLEARVPFLDYRLVELLFSLGAGDLIERGQTKAVLRRALGDLLPPVVRDRVDKLGFVTPEAAWLRGGLGELRRGRLRVPRVSRARLRRRRSRPAEPRASPHGRAGGRLRALARALRRALGARVPLGSATVTTQEQVRDWWNRNPMSYDVDDPIPYEEGSREFFREIDRRIFHPRYMRLTADASGKPFSLFVDFDSLRGKDVLDVGIGSGIADADVRRGRREGDRRRPAPTGRSRRPGAGSRRSGSRAVVRQADAEQLPFADASFDLVFSWGVIHHSSDMDRALAELVRVTPARRADRADGLPPPLALLRRLPRASSGSCRSRAGSACTSRAPARARREGLIARHFTVDELRRKLEGAGLTNVWIQPYGQDAELLPLPRRIRCRSPSACRGG